MYERPYEKLIVWQEAHKLCLQIYRIAKLFPIEERFTLAQQMRRAALSVTSNIAEGNSRRSKNERRHFIDIASGSLEELHSQSRVACDLAYISLETFQQITEHTHKISYLLQKLRRSLC